MVDLLSNGLHEKANNLLLSRLDVELVKKITLEIVMGQQMKEEVLDQNY